MATASTPLFPAFLTFALSVVALTEAGAQDTAAPVALIEGAAVVASLDSGLADPATLVLEFGTLWSGRDLSVQEVLDPQNLARDLERDGAYYVAVHQTLGQYELVDAIPLLSAWERVEGRQPTWTIGEAYAGSNGYELIAGRYGLTTLGINHFSAQPGRGDTDGFTQNDRLGWLWTEPHRAVTFDSFWAWSFALETWLYVHDIYAPWIYANGDGWGQLHRGQARGAFALTRAFGTVHTIVAGDLNLETDPVTILAVELDGDDLLITLAYSGGCREHDVTLTAVVSPLAIFPPYVTLNILHDDQGDRCEAIVPETLRYPLDDIRRAAPLPRDSPMALWLGDFRIDVPGR